MIEIKLVRAPNPGPYTGPGTNTYVIHNGEHALVLDPGPVIATHESAIVSALDGLSAAGVAVTHTHPDHAPLANPLARRLDVPTFGFAPGPAFSPDVLIGDGDALALGEDSLLAVHTPGHTWDHLCYLAGTRLFSGDHIIGGSSVIIEDAAAYFASLHRVAALGLEKIYPGHGDEIVDAMAAVREYIEHRKEREDEIVAAVAGGASTAREITEAVYGGIDSALVPAAAAQVEVQLQKLIAEDRLSLHRSGTDDQHVTVPAEGN